MNTLDKIIFYCLMVICGFITIALLVQCFIRGSFGYLVMTIVSGLLTAAIAKMILGDNEEDR